MHYIMFMHLIIIETIVMMMMMMMMMMNDYIYNNCDNIQRFLLCVIINIFYFVNAQMHTNRSRHSELCNITFYFTKHHKTSSYNMQYCSSMNDSIFCTCVFRNKKYFILYMTVDR